LRSAAFDNGRELLEKIAEGDESAFRQLYDEYWSEVYAAAFYYFHSHLYSQDIVQEVFLKIWIKRKELSGVKNAGAFLRVLTRNLIIDTLRRQTHQKLSLDLDQAVSRTERGRTPDAMLEVKEVEWHIKAAVDRLSPQLRKVYQLRRDQGLSLGEVAEQLGISYNTAREHMSRALRSIRAYLQENLGHLYLLALLFIYY
jgi:RNA polymerase sigma-70 factor (ECF subfamily)